MVLLKRPAGKAQAGKAEATRAVALKRPVGQAEAKPTVTAPDSDAEADKFEVELRDRMKARLFKDLWGSVPEFIQK
eukprot:14515086-Alexandrium_andersonii.AAC.1